MRRILAWWLLFGLLAAANVPTARAADEDPRRVEAEALMKEGIALEGKKQENEALVRFQRAYALYPTANILFAMASAEQVLGKSLPSLRHFRQAMKMPTLHPSNMQRGKEYVRELESALGRILVKAPAGTVLLVDGVRYEGSLDEAIDLEVGKHALAASLAGREKRVPATVAAGTSETVTIVFDSAPRADLPSVATTPAPTGMIVLAGGLGAGAIAATVAAIVFHGNATEAVDEARKPPARGRLPRTIDAGLQPAGCASVRPRYGGHADYGLGHRGGRVGHRLWRGHRDATLAERSS